MNPEMSPVIATGPLTRSPLYLPDSVPKAIFQLEEALEAYLIDVRARREQRREANRLRLFWQEAIRKICVELAQTECEQDTELFEELQAVLAEFERRLCDPGFSSAPEQAHSLFAPLEETALPADVRQPESLSPIAVEHPMECPPVPVRINLKSGAQPACLEQMLSGKECVEAVVSVAAREANEIRPSAEETLALKAILAQIGSIRQEWQDLDAREFSGRDEALNRPAAFELRRLVCRLGVLQESIPASVRFEASRAEIATEIDLVLDSMVTARTYANETSPALPFDQDAWNGAARLDAGAWEMLGQRYEDMASAQKAWNWYEQSREALSLPTRLELVNAIAARQQNLFRLLNRLEGEDRLQGDLFGRLKEEALLVGFLRSLHIGTGQKELDATADALPRLLDKAGAEATTQGERKKKDALQEAALTEVVACTGNLNFDPMAEKECSLSRAKLFPLLDRCLASGVPYTNLKLREALFDIAPVLLFGEPRFKKILTDVMEARKRMGLDLPAEDEEEDGEEIEEMPTVFECDMSVYQELVASMLQGKKLLLLGGVDRPRVCDELKSLLGCAEVRWIESERKSRISKHQAEIGKYDWILLLKNHLSHGLTEKGREWAKEAGKECLLLPAGYGVKQIVYQIYQKLLSREKRVKSTPIPVIASLSMKKDFFSAAKN